MPGALTVKELKSVNPKIDLGEIDLLMALYAGGKRFDKFKPEFLIHREAETLGLANIDSRLKRAQYVNRAAGLIDGVVSKATVGSPKIVGDDERWEELNKNSDGQGTPFSSLVRVLLSDMLVARWPYIEARSVDSEPYTLWRRDPETVLDFENNDDGSLNWIKTQAILQDRSSQYAAPDRQKVVITYYTESDTVSYVVYKKDDVWQTEDGRTINDDTMIQPEDDLSIYGHDFGQVPIFRGNATKTHWLMDRISEALKAIYNTEVDLAFSLSQCAYAQLIFELDNPKNANSITRSEAGAWVVQRGDKASYLAPPNTAFDGLFKNLERLTASLTESLNMMAAETAEIPQAGRLSGVAVQEHRRPLDSLICALVWPVADMLQRSLNAIADAEGIDYPTIEGLGKLPELPEVEETPIVAVEENTENIDMEDIENGE